MLCVQDCCQNGYHIHLFSSSLAYVHAGGFQPVHKINHCRVLSSLRHNNVIVCAGQVFPLGSTSIYTLSIHNSIQQEWVVITHNISIIYHALVYHCVIICIITLLELHADQPWFINLPLLCFCEILWQWCIVLQQCILSYPDSY